MRRKDKIVVLAHIQDEIVGSLYGVNSNHFWGKVDLLGFWHFSVFCPHWHKACLSMSNNSCSGLNVGLGSTPCAGGQRRSPAQESILELPRFSVYMMIWKFSYAFISLCVEIFSTAISARQAIIWEWKTHLIYKGSVCSCQTTYWTLFFVCAQFFATLIWGS